MKNLKILLILILFIAPISFNFFLCLWMELTVTDWQYAVYILWCILSGALAGFLAAKVTNSLTRGES